MKKVLSILLIGIVVIGLTGCGSTNKDEMNSGQKKNSSTNENSKVDNEIEFDNDGNMILRCNDETKYSNGIKDKTEFIFTFTSDGSKIIHYYRKDSEEHKNKEDMEEGIKSYETRCNELNSEKGVSCKVSSDEGSNKYSESSIIEINVDDVSEEFYNYWFKIGQTYDDYKNSDLCKK